MAQGLFILFGFYQLVRVTCELTASENNHLEGLWQTLGKHKSQISSMAVHFSSVP